MKSINEKRLEPEEEETKPKTLWEMFMDYVREKEKTQGKRLIEAV